MILGVLLCKQRAGNIIVVFARDLTVPGDPELVLIRAVLLNFVQCRDDSIRTHIRLDENAHGNVPRDPQLRVQSVLPQRVDQRANSARPEEREHRERRFRERDNDMPPAAYLSLILLVALVLNGIPLPPHF